jgi:hypothetical protein
MKKIIVVALVVMIPVALIMGCSPSKNYIGVKFYPPHNEWTPQPGAARVGVDRWAIELHLEANLVKTTNFTLFAGANPEFHFMVDFPDDLESDYVGDLRDITVQYFGGVRYKELAELRCFHGYEHWYPSPRKYSRWKYTGIEARYYWIGD